ncbi:MAG: hypothetical protein QOF71_244 [Candidatus Eremiobacteraeota bacterium]|jgi:hypothetical protein|nr:hypothetical protein [Candidatus Eremiobacteraeota bacterium]
MGTRLAELFAKLGQPVSRGTHVRFDGDNIRSRYAFVVWACNATTDADSSAAASACGSACIAYNVIPYENDEFPEDNWTFEPCRRHEHDP